MGKILKGSHHQVVVGQDAIGGRLPPGRTLVRLAAHDKGEAVEAAP